MPKFRDQHPSTSLPWGYGILFSNEINERPERQKKIIIVLMRKEFRALLLLCYKGSGRVGGFSLNLRLERISILPVACFQSFWPTFCVIKLWTEGSLSSNEQLILACFCNKEFAKVCFFFQETTKVLFAQFIEYNLAS